jgi:type II secretory pathway component PulJ
MTEDQKPITEDYNTSREKMAIPEYGRNIHKMVQHISTLEDREERNKAARTVIAIMGNMNPHLRDINDFKHKLWDHLAIISEFKLDIDSPYEPPALSTLTEKPKTVPYNDYPIRYKHYGKILEQMIMAATEMEEGEKKEALIQMIANHMKKSYLTWNRSQVTDDIIFNDLRELSGGKIERGSELRLSESKDILSRSKKKKPTRKFVPKHQQR